MIEPYRDYMAHAGSWFYPPNPTRRRIIHVTPLHFLAPAGYLIGSLPLEPAMAYYRYLAKSAVGFEHVGQLLSGHGTCTGRDWPREFMIGPVKNKTPAQVFTEDLRNRFRHALLGPCYGSGWKWRKSVGLLPGDYTKTQRLFIPWRGDVCGSAMEEQINILGNLARRRFCRSPNSSHRRAIYCQNVTIGVDQYGYVAGLQYGYFRDSSSWTITSYSRLRDTFYEFVQRAIAEFETALTSPTQPGFRDKMALEDAAYNAHKRGVSKK